MSLDKLSSILNIEFNDTSLLEEALTHASYINENKDKGLKDNERLEFLGDAVLDIVISEILFKKFPLKTEGELTLMRSNLVNKKTLAKVSREMSLSEFLFLGKGEEKNNARNSEKFQANVLEAIIGAIYLDLGFDKVKFFIENNFEGLINTLDILELNDYKTSFQEFFQEKYKKDPQYVETEEDGFFVSKVFIDEENSVTGRGKSKKEAQMAAAREALEVLKNG